MIKKILLLFITIQFLGFTSPAQPYVEGGKTRHRFAQLSLGLDSRLFSGYGSQSSFSNTSGQIEKFKLKNHAETRLIIGGTHFWGHADFYIAIPVASFGKSGFFTSVETGAKYFPWRIERNKIRPYIGSAWLPTLFQQGQGVTLIRFKYPITTGFVFNYKNHLIELGAGYNYDNKENYYITATASTQIKTHPYWISFGYKFMIETTVSAEKGWQNGKTKKLTDTLEMLHRLNGFTLAVGPSAAFFLKSSPHNESVAPFADNHKAAFVFPEFGLGYYLHKPDLQFNLSYRSIKSEIDAYDFSQTAKRKALTFEAFKFFADYNGFAVFAGPALSYEWLNVTETSQQQITTVKYEGVKPGITFGWDIRPNRLQSWYLRTNLRYFPNMNVKMPDNKNLPFDQLEFNFIQLVVFPGRIFNK